MFIHYLRQSCLLLIVLSFSNITYADIYKWVDEQGETHYSQLPPKDQQAKLIKAPPPPALDPNKAQEKIDDLVSQHDEARKKRLEQQEQAKQAAEQEAIRKQNCSIAKHNLQQYQDNPGRRVMDAEGNVTRLKEEERLQKIKEFQQNVNEFCN